MGAPAPVACDSAPSLHPPALREDTPAPAANHAADPPPQSTPNPRSSRPPRRYQARPRAPSELPTSDGGEPIPASREPRALPIDVRLLFRRGGACVVSLLAQRSEDLPSSVSVTGGGGVVELSALQDEWYEDVILENLGAVLRDGTEWVARTEERHVRWVLSGRDVYVLRASSFLGGFVSAPKLTLGAEQVVLCLHSCAPQVLAVLAEAGATGTLAEGTSGVPEGWVVLRGVAPTRAVPPVEGDDILNVLRPRADFEIEFRGGLRLGRGRWLWRHPPVVIIRGEPPASAQVTIDRKSAMPDADGVYRCDGWDAPGTHEVWCGDRSRSYTLDRPAEDWEAWCAHGPLPAPASSGRLVDLGAICGALVSPPPAPQGYHTVSVPSTNPLLLGARPTDVWHCGTRTDILTGRIVASVPFEPVWALPADLMRCNRERHAIRLVGRPVPPAPEVFQYRGAVTPRWASLILDACRRRLRVSPGANADLWLAYKLSARSIRRRASR